MKTTKYRVRTIFIIFNLFIINLCHVLTQFPFYKILSIFIKNNTFVNKIYFNIKFII
jgi:hypothetical protein